MNTAKTIEIKINKISQSRIGECDFNNIKFGSVFSDHMFIATYEKGKWDNFSIVPFGEISLLPSISALHYGQSIFEGMKAFKDSAGNAQLFRPLDNWKRMNISADRMAMPNIPVEIFMEGLKTLVSIDKDWIPTKEGSALYIRPFLFATDEFVGVRPSEKFMFIIFTCPVNSYYPKPINVLVEDKYVRAFDGGAGFAKAAGNYGISMMPTMNAQKNGFDQLIWTDGKEHEYIEESGTMNVFFQIEDVLYTPKLDNTILNGITRDSCIKLLESAGYKVLQEKLSIHKILEAYQNGKLLDAFGTGTAALIAKIESINYKNIKMTLPNPEQRIISNWLYKELEDIRCSKAPDNFDWIVKI